MKIAEIRRLLEKTGKKKVYNLSPEDGQDLYQAASYLLAKIEEAKPFVEDVATGARHKTAWVLRVEQAQAWLDEVDGE